MKTFLIISVLCCSSYLRHCSARGKEIGINMPRSAHHRVSEPGNLPV